MHPVPYIVAACALLAAEPPASDDGPRPIGEFRPSEHGFNFVNAFSGTPLPISLGGLEAAIGVPSEFGLCGGMSAAAADFFLAGVRRPETVHQPGPGTPLYSYIYRRQNDSLGASLEQAGRFAGWMRLPTGSAGGTRARSVPEIGAAADAIAAGRPVALGLVLRGPERPGKLWENHQVLAFAVDGAGSSRVSIRVYDPNYPNMDGVSIESRAAPVGEAGVWGLPGVRVPVLGATMQRRAGDRTTPVRGVFIMPYSPSPPPADIHPRR